MGCELCGSHIPQNKTRERIISPVDAVNYCIIQGEGY